jgi:hypothetical protein
MAKVCQQSLALMDVNLDWCDFIAGKRGEILYVKNDIVSYKCSDLNQFESGTIWCKIEVDKYDDIIVAGSRSK